MLLLLLYLSMTTEFQLLEKLLSIYGYLVAVWSNQHVYVSCRAKKQAEKDRFTRKLRSDHVKGK